MEAGEWRRQGDKGKGRDIKTHRGLDVYRRAFKAVMRLLELTEGFSEEEIYS